MTKEYSKFIEMLTESRLCAWHVAEWLTRLGFVVKILPATTTPDEGGRFDHVDFGDLEIIKRVEVKYWPEIDFHAIEDVPYNDIIVDEAYKIDKFPKQTLYGYVILNKSKNGCMLIANETRPFWFKKEVFDKKENALRTFYFCPKGKIHYAKIEIPGGKINVGGSASGS